LIRFFWSGTPVELKSKLQDFGIPSSIIPISDSGEVLSKQETFKWAERRLEERSRRIKLHDGDPGNLSSVSASRPEDDVVKVLQLGQDETESLNSVVTPSNSDILLGRGRLCREHVVSLLRVCSRHSSGLGLFWYGSNECVSRLKGNVMLRQFMDKRWHMFDALPTKAAKTRMADDLVRQVKIEFGGRFLEEKGFSWIEVPDKVARTKVATYFRTLRSMRKKDQDMTM
jgi:hypothetical protein